MSNLLDFLSNFAVAPQKQLAFLLNPDAAMRDSTLTEVEQRLLKHGRREEISLAFADKAQWPSCTFVDPGPDPTPDPDTPPDEEETEQPELQPDTPKPQLDDLPIEQ
jgi:hypothetical protein